LNACITYPILSMFWEHSREFGLCQNPKRQSAHLHPWNFCMYTLD
jgi:hypothetical protein